MSSKKKSTSSARVSDAHEKSTDKLSVKEFRDRTIQRGAPVPPAGIAHGIPPFHQDSTRLHSSQYHPGADGMQHYQHAPVRASVFSSIGDGTARLDEGRGEGTGDGPGCVGGVEASGEALFSKLFLKDSGRQGEVVQDAAVCAEPDGGHPGAPRIRHQHSPQEDAKRGSVWGALYCEGSPDLPGVKEADAEKRRALLDNREKKKNEGTLRKAPGQKRDADSPPKKTPAKRRKLVKNGKGVKESTPPKEFAPPPITHEAEAASVNHPDSRNPDADAAEAVSTTPMEEEGAEIQSQPSDDPNRLALVLVTGSPSKRPRSARNLRSGLLGRLQDRQQEIEVSCSSAHDAHPDGSEVEMATEPPTVPAMVPAEGNPVNDAVCGSASPFSYAELEEKLKQIPPGLPTVMPLAQMFEMVETLVSGLRGMANQYDLFTDLLRTTDYMKAFAARHKDTEDQLRLRLVEAEASVSTARGENEALRADLADAKSREESMEGPSAGGRG
ncbi:hypothetical protein CK203_088506 [Vitis vinifera]|uniref:Uncharacterized protein n=1 Tax=Vitis vinifera TaxID=29760 RepID=A0A438F062_VITVI|nr:hypothetical protein CK203_088506 [Vitis vinifera]